RQQDRLVILDEVHRAPALFPVLRGLIDRGRREGRREGLYSGRLVRSCWPRPARRSRAALPSRSWGP
ncbi:MAG: hypothetical protein VKQ33_03055, partial [Candidatus Sericytochromatia bacterium]|nr:hypothetical protein [Candidatus Sericytochromatia bacterium]